MNDEEYVLDRIQRVRPTAKFVAYNYSKEFIEQVPDVNVDFHYINLYDEQIDATLIKSKRGLLLIHNTYLASFAYNLFLCWLYSATEPAAQSAVLGKALLKHNFKKFFAEQLIHSRNSILSRMIFLQTLLFEQKMMVPVFEARTRDPDLDSQAQTAAGLMSLIVSLHELGHFFFGNQPGAWDSFLGANRDTVGRLFERVSKRYSPAFVEEFQCDAYATVSCARLYGERAGSQFAVRAILFAFAAFAVLVSLARSAQKTTQDQADMHDEVDLRSIEKTHREFRLSVGVDRDFAVRAQLAAELCSSLAGQGGFALFGRGQPFDLPETIGAELQAFLDFSIAETDDSNARDMSLLVAEALQGHEQGLQYLYLRSKTFATNRPGKLQV